MALLCGRRTKFLRVSLVLLHRELVAEPLTRLPQRVRVVLEKHIARPQQPPVPVSNKKHYLLLLLFFSLFSQQKKKKSEKITVAAGGRGFDARSPRAAWRGSGSSSSREFALLAESSYMFLGDRFCVSAELVCDDSER
jgi:hypothetical protein